MEKLKNPRVLVPFIISCFVLLGIIYGGVRKVIAYQNKFAKVAYVEQCDTSIKEDINLLSESIEQINKSVNQVNIGIKVDKLQERIWALEDRYGGPGVPNAPSQEVKDTYRQLQKDYADKLKEMED